MHLREALAAALHSTCSAQLRTVITSFGIVLDVAAIVSLTSFTTGLRDGFNTRSDLLSRAVFIPNDAPRVPGTTAVPLKESGSDTPEDQAETPESQLGTVTPRRNGVAVIRYGTSRFRRGR